MQIASYDTNPSRVIVSLITGAVTGAILIALEYVWGTAQVSGIRYVLDHGLRTTFIVFTAALVVWGLGLSIVGIPIWWLFHTLRLRHWLAAVVVGAVMTFLVNFAIGTRLFELIPPPANSTYFASDSGGPTVIDSRLTPHGWWVNFQAALLLSAGGVVVALVIWRIAYRRASDVPERGS
jgi:hypothetical protein